MVSYFVGVFVFFTIYFIFNKDKSDEELALFGIVKAKDIFVFYTIVYFILWVIAYVELIILLFLGVEPLHQMVSMEFPHRLMIGFLIGFSYNVILTLIALYCESIDNQYGFMLFGGALLLIVVSFFMHIY